MALAFFDLSQASADAQDIMNTSKVLVILVHAIIEKKIKG